MAHGGTASARDRDPGKESRWSHKKPKREPMEILCCAKWGGMRRTTRRRSVLHLVSARHDARDLSIIADTKGEARATGPVCDGAGSLSVKVAVKVAHTE